MQQSALSECPQGECGWASGQTDGDDTACLRVADTLANGLPCNAARSPPIIDAIALNERQTPQRRRIMPSVNKLGYISEVAAGTRRRAEIVRVFNFAASPGRRITFRLPHGTTSATRACDDTPSVVGAGDTACAVDRRIVTANILLAVPCSTLALRFNG